MRPLALLLLALSLTAAELEQITLTDGRRLIGYYDGGAGTLTVEGPPKAVIRVAPTQIASRAAYVRPVETDPVKRDEAELIRLEAEHAAAVADATRLRDFAGKRSGKDAEVAMARANDRMEQAGALAEKIDALKAKVAETKSPQPLIGATVADLPKSKTSLEEAQEGFVKARAEAARIRQQAVEVEFIAALKWLEAMDLNQQPVLDLGIDPRQSEVEARNRAILQNAFRSRYAKILEDARRADVSDREVVLGQLLSVMSDERDGRIRKTKAR